MVCTLQSFREIILCSTAHRLLLQLPTKTWKYNVENNLNFLALWFRYPNYSQDVDIHISS